MNPEILNMMSPHIKIHYKLQARSHVTLTVYDPLDRQIATLVNEVEERGDKSVNFNSNGLANGRYWYRLFVQAAGQNGKSKSYTQRKKMVLVK
jgi:hypothetical protein